MPLHKLNQAKNTSFQFKKKKYISKCFFLFKVNKSLPAHLQTPDMRMHTDTLVHKLLTLEHSDTQMSLWLV